MKPSYFLIKIKSLINYLQMGDAYHSLSTLENNAWSVNSLSSLWNKDLYHCVHTHAHVRTHARAHTHTHTPVSYTHLRCTSLRKVEKRELAANIMQSSKF